MKVAIKNTLNNYEIKVSSRVVLQEYKRRVLGEAVYLLNKLRTTGSFQATLEHVANVLPTQQSRKRNICLTVLVSLFPNVSDEERTERAQRYLRSLLLHGQRSFQSSVDSVLEGTGCYWAMYPVTEKKAYKTYDLGKNKCSAAFNRCGIGKFLRSKIDRCRELLTFLDGIDPAQRTKEIDSARRFLVEVINNEDEHHSSSFEPCKSVGDLLIALESDGFKNFYSKNYKESLAFCDALGQNFIYRPNNFSSGEITLQASNKPWPQKL